MSEPPWKALVEAANRARDHAHAPYSNYRVGAALVTGDGRIFAGCNVENASYGVTLCAERNAVAQMVAAGARDIAALVVVTQGPEPGNPCGVCRQTLAEFAADLTIGLAILGDDAPRAFKTLREIFPEPFRSDLVRGS
jgi:cytidine deaminase